MTKRRRNIKDRARTCDVTPPQLSSPSVTKVIKRSDEEYEEK